MYIVVSDNVLAIIYTKLKTQSRKSREKLRHGKVLVKRRIVESLDLSSEHSKDLAINTRKKVFSRGSECLIS